MLKLIDGRVYDEQGVEVTDLMPWQQDIIIKQLYPEDDILLTESEFRRRSTSWSGRRYIPELHDPAVNMIIGGVKRPSPADYADEPVDIENWLRDWADRVNISRNGCTDCASRIIALYNADMNLELASKDLGLSLACMRKWWWRFKSSISDELKAELFSVLQHKGS